MASPWRLSDAIAIAIYNFVPTEKEKSSGCLSFSIGDLVIAKEETDEWYRGTLQPTQYSAFHSFTDPNANNGSYSYIFPKIFFLLKNKLESTDPVIKEIKSVIKEWGSLIKFYYVENRLVEYRTIRDQFKNLLDYYRILISPQAQASSLGLLKQKAMHCIEEGKRVMGFDLILKNESEVLSDKNTFVLDLYKKYQEVGSEKSSTSSVMSQNSLSANSAAGNPNKSVIFSIGKDQAKKQKKNII